MAKSPTRQKQQQTEATVPSDIKEILLTALPSVKVGIKVLRSADPLKAIQNEDHSWFGTFIAMSIIMGLAMLVILANDGAPFVDPWTSLWRTKFAFYVEPDVNWPVLVQCGLYALGACMTGYLASMLAGLHLSGGIRATRKNAVKLAIYAALAAAFSYFAVLIVIFVLGWILYALNFRIFVLGWMTIAAVVLLPMTTWLIARVFRRTSLPSRASILAPITISMAAVTGSAIGAILINDVLMDAFLAKGKIINGVRRTPTSAVVQTCARTPEDIVCAITLFPSKWQDYELIGDWRLENAPNGDGLHPIHSYWRPTQESERLFALVTLESPKDITIEIRTAASVVCTPNGTRIANGNQFFSIQGRVLGQQHTTPQEMRIRIDNLASGFVTLVNEACLSRIILQ